MAEGVDPTGGPAAPAAAPALADALGWVGFEVDDVAGEQIGRVHTAYLDAASREPAWLIVALGRGRSKRRAAVPIAGCAGGGRRVWTAYPAETVRGAPTVDVRRPLLREHELTICAHFGIGEAVGRAAEVAGRPANAITAQPA